MNKMAISVIFGIWNEKLQWRIFFKYDLNFSDLLREKFPPLPAAPAVVIYVYKLLYAVRFCKAIGKPII